MRWRSGRTSSGRFRAATAGTGRPCAARLGLGDEAARLQAEHCRNTQHWPQGFWDSPSSPYWAGGLVDCPYFDSSGVNAATTTEMLLQSYDGTIRVWPAVPNAWSGVFRLRAETGFMVVSERAAGQVRYVAIESLFGGPCRLVNPWNVQARVTQDGQTVLETDKAEIAFATSQGKTYLVERPDSPLSQFAMAPLAPAPNQDVKSMSRPRRSRGPLAPRQGPPMLGITRDGWTAPARQLRKTGHARKRPSKPPSATGRGSQGSASNR